MRWLSASVACTMIVIGSASAGDPPTKVRPVIEWTGTDSSVPKSSYIRCQSPKELQAAWKDHYKDRDHAHRAAPVPEVDFDRYMLLALFQGNGSQNYGLYVIEILDEPAGLRVRYGVSGYQVALALSEEDRRYMATRSYAFVVIPRSDKVVTFEQGYRSMSDDPWEWTKVGTAPAVVRKK
jgi:hypothetical protein